MSDSAKMVTAEQCLQRIKDAALDLPLEEHEAAMTVDEWAPAHAKFATQGSQLTRCLFMKDKKKQHFLLVTLASTKTDLKLFAKAQGAKEPRFAPEETLNSMLGVVKGAVNPFSIVNDTEGSVKLCLEKALVESKEAVCFHPMDNSKTVVAAPEQLLAFLKHNGREFDVVDLTVDPNAPAAAPKPAKAAKPAKAPKEKKEDEKGVNKEGMQDTKEGDFAKWYQQVITKAELIEYYDIKGCYILRPPAMGIWKKIVDYMDAFITDDLEVDPCYFPMFVSKHALEKEEGHIDGFAAEVAWVTKSGSSDLEEPIAVRPTSETVMYPAFAKWIRSWRDLPLKLNQWCNVVRWEFSHATPFIRTREFLWQEGHTAHATQAAADKEVRDVLDLYARVYEDLLAVPVAKGKKTEKEKFAGGSYTTTVEAFVPTVGRSVQGATSHCLGDNFGKMFNITYEDENKKHQIPIQNSWGMTTRTIGVMIMVHGDNKGLVLPPRVATTQVVFVPVGINNKTKHRQDEILNKCTELTKELKKAGIRAKADIRDTVTSGNKCNHWELRGVPIRLEVGPNELDKNVVHACFRFNGEKLDLSLDDLAGNLQAQLDRVHNTMLANARKVRDERTELMRAGEWDKFVPFLNQLKVAIVPFCGGVKCEEEIKKVSADTAQELKESAGEGEEFDERAPSMGAKSLCIPFDQPTEELGTKCFNPNCKAAPVAWTLFGRSY